MTSHIKTIEVITRDQRPEGCIGSQDIRAWYERVTRVSPRGRICQFALYLMQAGCSVKVRWLASAQARPLFQHPSWPLLAPRSPSCNVY